VIPMRLLLDESWWKGMFKEGIIDPVYSMRSVSAIPTYVSRCGNEKNPNL
jgi:hypothetical protein